MGGHWVRPRLTHPTQPPSVFPENTLLLSGNPSAPPHGHLAGGWFYDRGPAQLLGRAALLIQDLN